MALVSPSPWTSTIARTSDFIPSPYHPLYECRTEFNRGLQWCSGLGPIAKLWELTKPHLAQLKVLILSHDSLNGTPPPHSPSLLLSPHHLIVAFSLASVCDVISWTIDVVGLAGLENVEVKENWRDTLTDLQKKLNGPALALCSKAPRLSSPPFTFIFQRIW